MLNKTLELKIADLGFARRDTVAAREDDEEDEAYDFDESRVSEYVVTRWWRAPEVMLAERAYTKAIGKVYIGE